MLIMKIGSLPNASRTPAERLPDAPGALPDASRTLPERTPDASRRRRNAPDASQAHWNPEFTALERTGSGVSWRSRLARYTRTVLLTVPE